MRKLEAFTEEVIHYFVWKASINTYILEGICKITTEEVTQIDTQLKIHKVTLKLLEPMKYKTIAEEANTWAAYISSLEGPT